jgi:hypothetical protein
MLFVDLRDATETDRVESFNDAASLDAWEATGIAIKLKGRDARDITFHMHTADHLDPTKVKVLCSLNPPPAPPP